MERQDLQARTKQFALHIIQLVNFIPNSLAGRVLAQQILRSGTSVGANYREACRARSTAEFISKTNIGLQELEETRYWLELLQESALLNHNQCNHLIDEVNQLIAIFVTVIKRKKEHTNLNTSS
ncbi:four helix bundle protein [Herpetosiphon llansteffanensis]